MDRFWIDFWSNVDKGLSDECWIWGGATVRGYGRAGSPRYGTGIAHRLAWMYEYGKIPSTVELHHRCHTRACVNPDHLEPMTKPSHSRLTWSERGLESILSPC